MNALVKVNTKIVCILLLLITLGVFSGCSNLTKAAKTPSIKEIDEKIKQSVDISTLQVANYAKFKKLYGITRGEVEEFVLYRAPSNIKADEIAIIKVKDANQVNSIKEKILKRADKQAASFRDYLPDEYYLIQNKVLTVNNNYILFAVSKDSEKISSVFEKCFE